MKEILVLKKKHFSNIPIDMNLNDPIYVYNNGNRMHILPLALMYEENAIWTDYYDNGIKCVITLTYCPITHTCVGYFGKWKIDSTHTDVLHINGDQGIIRVIDGRIIEGDQYQIIRKIEVKVMTIRNSISSIRDGMFFTMEDGARLDELEVPNNNKPIWGIEYYSSNPENSILKYSALIPKNKNANKWDITANNIRKYVATMMESLRNRGAIIIPCSEKSWFHYHPNSKKVVM